MIERLIKNTIGALIGLVMLACAYAAAGAALIGVAYAISEGGPWLVERYKAAQADHCDYIARPRGNGTYELEAC